MIHLRRFERGLFHDVTLISQSRKNRRRLRSARRRHATLTRARHHSFMRRFELVKREKLTRFFSYVPVLMKCMQSSKGEAVQWVISLLEIL